MRNLILGVFLTVFSLPCFAQTDYQLRPLVHWQAGHLAGWSVLPDVTQPVFKTLEVAGWLDKDESGWKEFMAGALITSDGKSQLVLNLRAYQRSKRSDLYAELHVLTNRAIADTFVTFQLPRGMRLGAESEFTTALVSQIKSTAGLGPRVSVRIPKTSLSVATTCFFNIKASPVIRTYVVYNLTR